MSKSRKRTAPVRKRRSRKSGQKRGTASGVRRKESPGKDRIVHYVFGPAAAALRTGSKPREKPKPWGYGLKLTAVNKDTDGVYAILKNKSSGESLLMSFDHHMGFFRAMDAFGNLLEAGAEDKWHEPLLEALVGPDMRSSDPATMEASARQLRKYFRRYEHLVASFQLFPSISTMWASHKANSKMKDFVLRHSWDGASFRPTEYPAETIPYHTADISEFITDVKEWYEQNVDK